MSCFLSCNSLSPTPLYPPQEKLSLMGGRLLYFFFLQPECQVTERGVFPCRVLLNGNALDKCNILLKIKSFLLKIMIKSISQTVDFFFFRQKTKALSLFILRLWQSSVDKNIACFRKNNPEIFAQAEKKRLF